MLQYNVVENNIPSYKLLKYHKVSKWDILLVEF